MRTFLVAAREKSTSRAAEKLGISRATVQTQIRRLQDKIGAQLIVSNTSGLTLTSHGEESAKSLSRVDRDIFALAREVATPRGVPQGIVRLGCPDGLALIFVTPALRSFSEKYPQIQVHLNALSNYRSLRENLTDCIMAFSPDEHKDVTNIQLGWLHLVPVASRQYVDEFGLPTKENLSDHYFIETEKYSAPVPIWQGWQGAVKQGRARHFSDSSIIYAMMVKSGLGIGLLASYVLQEPTAVHIDIGIHVRLPLYASFLTDRLEAKPVAIIRDLLVSLFGPDERWFSKDLIVPVGLDPGFKVFHDL
ncbi:LysR family transcriptional regulator [Methylobacterium sp. sgz302541]|uniref:LysR family transcriptional regulator n=1 Tax=unclassified Methylobacterium TaxID=2615210 RepID=UPI003D33C451